MKRIDAPLPATLRRPRLRKRRPAPPSPRLWPEWTDAVRAELPFGPVAVRVEPRANRSA